MASSEQTTFHPKNTLGNTARTTMQTAFAGALVAGVENTMRKQNVGAMGIITRSGGLIALFTSVGAGYQFTKDASANLRQKDDAYNDAIAGFVAGNFVGIYKRSLPFMIGAGVVFGTVQSAFAYTEGFSPKTVTYGDEDEVERRETLKKLRRRPIEETIEQLGEGRGIYAPGYEERRRERLLAKYGVDVGPYQTAKS
ncbi:NADH-ubiquinone oxidoreductase 213 kDa subunit [Dendryphion nanum]|uniref:NADH-ubiquinone oxidoreductase 213 kDa subunit n=1 Tax=Dendryphion nanum TaxID=256645 RepID=A0A9P9EEL4_9PLEO|nr:NADH-ubiquinone oxidoreductase 213 kDa subunit [Dendryphion nanum]